MIVACEKDQDAIVKYLADVCEDLISTDTPAGYYPVHVCARYNRIKCLNILFQNGASLLSKTNDGQTPLHIAAQWSVFD